MRESYKLYGLSRNGSLVIDINATETGSVEFMGNCLIDVYAELVYDFIGIFGIFIFIKFLSINEQKIFCNIKFIFHKMGNFY